MVLEQIPLYHYRWLLYELVKRDVKLRYKGTVLGVVWTLLNPLLFMGVYTLIFSVFMRTTIPHYPLFLLSGLIPWIWFAGSISQATTSILGGGSYIGKTLMPAELLVLVPVLSQGFNFLITIVLLFVGCFSMGVNVGWALVFLPLLVAIQIVLTLAIAILVAAAVVFFPDIQQIVGYALTAAFFLTPIFYSRSIVPHNLRFLVDFNPLAGLFFGYQNVFYKGIPPDPNGLLVAVAFGMMALVVSLAYFNNVRDALAEQV